MPLTLHQEELVCLKYFDVSVGINIVNIIVFVHLQTECVKDNDDRLVLERNPLEWSVSDVVDFIASTDCASLAKIFQEQVHIQKLCI